jgi:hypothetical protein
MNASCKLNLKTCFMNEPVKYQPGLLSGLAGGALSLDVFSRDILLLSTHIAGIMHQDPQAIFDAISEGEILQLKREPANKYDELAIAVWKGSVKCGYMPRDKNEVISKLMDAGKTVFAKAGSIDWEDDNWMTIEMDVILRG